MKTQKGFTAIELVIAIVAVAVVAGWVANIVKIAMWSSFDPLTTMVVLRFVGIIVAPLGVVMGYIPT